MASVAEVCAHHSEIPRVSARDLDADAFQREYFRQCRPVVICDATDDWPARKWTISGLVERVGQNQVWIRGKTNSQDYREGKAYTIRKDTFANYCSDLLKGNARARSSYLAVRERERESILSFHCRTRSQSILDVLTNNVNE